MKILSITLLLQSIGYVGPTELSAMEELEKAMQGFVRQGSSKLALAQMLKVKKAGSDTWTTCADS